MHVQWFGQSAFHLGAGGTSVFIDPFGDMSGLTRSRGLKFDYPAIEGVESDLLLVTHEHADHTGVEAIGGDPAMLRSTGVATSQSTSGSQEAKDFKVVVTLTEPPPNLRPGLSCTAKVTTATRPKGWPQRS